MASSTPKTIVIRGNPDREERPAAAGITPGMLIEYASSSLDVQAHSTAAGNASRMFAVEDPGADDNTVAAIDHAYATGDQVRFVQAQPGDHLYAWLDDGGSVNAGDALQSSGDGALDLHGGTTNPESIVAYALEDNDNSGGTANSRLKIQVA